MGVLELHVVRVEGIGDDDMAMPRKHKSAGKVIPIIIAVIEKSTLLDEQATGVRARGRPGMPTDRTLPCRVGDRRHRARDGQALILDFHRGVAFPPPPVGRNLMPTRDGVARKAGRSLHGQTAGAHRALCVKAVEAVHDAPPADSRAVVKVRLDTRVRQAFKPVDDLIDRFVARIALRHTVFGTFLEIQDEGNRDAGIAGPLRVGWVAAVAGQVALILGHLIPLLSVIHWV